MEERNKKRTSSEIQEEEGDRGGWFVYRSKTKKADIIIPSNDTTMTHLRVDSSVREIPDQAFAYCEALEHVQLPVTLTRIGARAFNTCGYLKFVQFLVSSNDSRLETFSSVNLEAGTIVFPEREELLQIDEFAFLGCNSLPKVIVCSNSTKLGDAAFYNCRGLVHVELPEGLQEIE
eukprot:scaffold2749_cov70-Cylindrotheca_fusiformis.AAC.1